MNTDQEIAAEVSQYLQSQPLAQADFAAQYGPELEAGHREAATDAPQTRGLGELITNITEWVWRQVEPLVKQQICSAENYALLSSITSEQLSTRIDDILTPLAAGVTDSLPFRLKLLTPLLPALRKLIANIIARELQQASQAGWTAYCGVPAHSSAMAAAETSNPGKGE